MSKPNKKPAGRTGSNRWATMSRAGSARRAAKPSAKPASKRRVLDDYETPESATNALGPFLKAKGPILEPASGSGRMARALKGLFPGVKIETADIKRGADFLKRTKTHKGPCVTNPPYRDGQAEAFARQALKLCDGKVAMLMQSGFVWGSRRANGFFLAGYRPERIIIIPWRIMFIDGDGKEIEGQFFSHAWVIWPSRSMRALNKTTAVDWAEPPPEET